jgi:hypothetical protein
MLVHLFIPGMHNEWIRLHQDTEKKNIALWYVQAKGAKHEKHRKHDQINSGTGL